MHSLRVIHKEEKRSKKEERTTATNQTLQNVH
jgi:hypothetical protein